MADADCFALCFCCFCCSVGADSGGSWLCPCCHSHKSKFDDDPALKDPELDAIVERQLYEQRAAWNAAHPESGSHNPYAPQVPPAAYSPDSQKTRDAGHIRGSSHGMKEKQQPQEMPSPSHFSTGPTGQSQTSETNRMSMPTPKHVHAQPGSGPVMKEKV